MSKRVPGRAFRAFGQKGELRQETVLIRKGLELLSTTMTVRLGSMPMIGLGLLFAALKLS